MYFYACVQCEIVDVLLTCYKLRWPMFFLKQIDDDDDEGSFNCARS